MADVLGVAEVKKQFADVLGRVAYKGERFLIERRGRPMAAIVPVEDLERIEQEPMARGERPGIEDIDPETWDRMVDEMVADIYRLRRLMRMRPVDLTD